MTTTLLFNGKEIIGCKSYEIKSGDRSDEIIAMVTLKNKTFKAKVLFNPETGDIRLEPIDSDLPISHEIVFE